MNNVPEWAKKAAEEISKLSISTPRCDDIEEQVGFGRGVGVMRNSVCKHAAQIIAKHAPNNEQVRELVEAAREVEHDNMQLMGRARLRNALEPFK